ncbi:MAG: hypothetical protein J0H57_17805, partial [Rhodospirillales bacterium]|nr:hypothetical protein [Rhodospirillales bacterium]
PGRLVGNGAYRLDAWTPQASVELARNAHFHAAGSVAIERVRFVVTEDAASELKRFQAGDLHLTETVPPRPLAATHHGIHQTARLPRALLQGCRRRFEVERDRRRQHLDVPDLLRRRVEQHVAILVGRPTRTPGLKEILQADPDLALDAADRLLQLPREQRIGRVDSNRILQAGVVVIHR